MACAIGDAIRSAFVSTAVILVAAYLFVCVQFWGRGRPPNSNRLCHIRPVFNRSAGRHRMGIKRLGNESGAARGTAVRYLAVYATVPVLQLAAPLLSRVRDFVWKAQT